MPATLFERRFADASEDLSRVTLEAVRFLEDSKVGGHPAYVANLAIEELGTNILKYGYDDLSVHQILLQIVIDSGELRVILEDDGHPFNPLEVAVPDLQAPLEERSPGGLGLYMIRKMADHIDYERVDGRNRITVRIRITGGAKA